MGARRTIATTAAVSVAVVSLTTTASLQVSAESSSSTVDGAAFLDTFDAGVDGWVKSEVDQYTGTIA